MNYHKKNNKIFPLFNSTLQMNSLTDWHRSVMIIDIFNMEKYYYTTFVLNLNNNTLQNY